MTLFQRWQNNVETTPIELRRFNVDEPMLFQRWGGVVITTARLHSRKFELRFCAGSNPACGVSEIKRLSPVNHAIKIIHQIYQRWNLVENESWADVCLSTLFQRWQNNLKQHCKNYVDSMSMTNVVSKLTFSWKWK